MYFNVLKGDASLSMSQVNTVRAIDAAETGITRGSLMRINDDDKFVRTAADVASQGDADTPGPIIYIALHENNDSDVEMSGHMSALDVKQDMLIETDVWDTAGAYTFGTYLMAGANGKWTPHTDNKTAIGQVVKTSYKVFDNKAQVTNYSFTGAPVNALAIRTMYIPNLSVSE